MGHYDINNVICSVSDDTSTRYQVGDGSDCRTFPIEIQQLARPMSLLRLVHAFEEHKPHADMPLFVKTHTANMIANGIQLLPESLTKATIYIVRDPRDVCISFAKHLDVDIGKAIAYMDDNYRALSCDTERLKVRDFISSWHKHTHSFITGDLIGVKTFRYEDMISDPVHTFSDMLNHAGLSADYDRVKKALKDVQLYKLRNREQKEGFIEASPKNEDGFFGQGGSHWQEVLSTPQARRIEKIAGSYMEKFGYTGRKAA